jgi:DNA-binding NtrC family response regulator
MAKELKIPRRESYILVVEDDEATRKLYRRVLSGYRNVLFLKNGEEALDAISRVEEVSLGLIDFGLPGVSGLDVIRELKRVFPGAEAVVITGLDDVRAAVKSIQAGANNYITKPFNSAEIEALVARNQEKSRLREEVERLRYVLDARGRTVMVVGKSKAMRRVMETVESIAVLDTTVLILGETGTGKDLLARAIHEKSSRSRKPFVVTDCAALSENLIESELFGHEKGAFTGASDLRVGKFERAQGGTIFLNEIGMLSWAAQAKLLRVLQEGEIERLGGNKTIKVDVRVIAATSSDLEALIEKDKFQKALFYRLNTVTLYLPPLRERMEDLPLLVDLFLKRYTGKYGKKMSGPDEAAYNALYNYGWPGNIRELKHAVERAVVLARSPQIRVGDLPPVLQEKKTGRRARLTAAAKLNELERESIAAALAESGFNLSRAAKILGIARSTLYSKLKKHRLEIRSAQP